MALKRKSDDYNKDVRANWELKNYVVTYSDNTNHDPSRYQLWIKDDGVGNLILENPHGTKVAWPAACTKHLFDAIRDYVADRDLVTDELEGLE